MKEPEDQCVLAGNNASFPCVSSVTGATLHFIINNTEYYDKNELPSDIKFDGKQLSIVNVAERHNQTTIQCATILTTAEHCKSRIGTLTVVTEGIKIGEKIALNAMNGGSYFVVHAALFRMVVSVITLW